MLEHDRVGCEERSSIEFRGERMGRNTEYGGGFGVSRSAEGRS